MNKTGYESFECYQFWVDKALFYSVEKHKRPFVVKIALNPKRSLLWCGPFQDKTGLILNAMTSQKCCAPETMLLFLVFKPLILRANELCRGLNRGKLAERECYQAFSPPLYQSPPPLSIYLLSFVLSAPLYHSSLQRSDIASTHQWEDAFVRGLEQSRPLLFLFWGVIWLTAPAWGEWQVALVSLWQPAWWFEFVLGLGVLPHGVLHEHPYSVCGENTVQCVSIRLLDSCCVFYCLNERLERCETVQNKRVKREHHNLTDRQIKR